jgi:hypothetical protein
MVDRPDREVSFLKDVNPELKSWAALTESSSSFVPLQNVWYELIEWSFCLGSKSDLRH